MVQQQQYPVHSQGLLGLQTILFRRGRDVQRGMPGIQAKLSTMGMVCPLVDLGPTPELCGLVVEIRMEIGSETSVFHLLEVAL